jgi:hypothetical protein
VRSTAGALSRGSELVGEATRELTARANAELLVDLRLVRLDRAHGDVELCGDLLLGLAGGRELRDPLLGRPQLASRILTRTPAKGAATTRVLITNPLPGMSLYGAPWLQTWATSGKGFTHENGESKPNPLRWVATGCRLDPMVRRGSTVRVRQRASQKASNGSSTAQRRRNRSTKVPVRIELPTGAGEGPLHELG